MIEAQRFIEEHQGKPLGFQIALSVPMSGIVTKT
nr:MAG TPA: hypothetical protein [Caudoviricetes sp.]